VETSSRGCEWLCSAALTSTKQRNLRTFFGKSSTGFKIPECGFQKQIYYIRFKRAYQLTFLAEKPRNNRLKSKSSQVTFF
jgi:hypothetical protein